MYGLGNEEDLNQPLGAVETIQDRCIAFPNALQHQVQPFELIDKTKPGLRKIVVFFLVDPSRPVLSTAHIPPQQREWYERQLEDDLPLLPKGIRSLVTDYIGCVTLNAAKAAREELMKERKYYVDQLTKAVFQRPFSLCEH